MYIKLINESYIDDDSLKVLGTVWSKQMRSNGSPSGTLSKHSHPLSISAKRPHILVNPFKGELLIH